MKTRIIQTRFWDDEFVSETDIYTQHLYLYLLTSQYINICGIFQLTPAKIMFETKLTANQFETAKINLQKANKVYFYKGWVYVINAKKNNKYCESPKNQIAENSELSHVPDEIRSFFNSSMDSSIGTTMDSTPKSNTINNKPEIRNNKGTKNKTYFSKEVITQEDIEKIHQELHVALEDIQTMIDDIDAWSNGKGNQALNWYLTLRNWLNRAIKEGKIKQIINNSKSDEQLIRTTLQARNLGSDKN
jgi:hypothetical protein